MTQTITPNFIAYIAGPYRAANGWGIDENIQNARRVSVFLWANGVANICPHSNTAHFDGVATDDFFLQGGLEILRRCDAVVLVGAWSNSTGTKMEIRTAEQEGIPVFKSAQELLGHLQGFGIPMRKTPEKSLLHDKE